MSFEVVKKIESFKEEGFVSIGLGPAEYMYLATVVLNFSYSNDYNKRIKYNRD